MFGVKAFFVTYVDGELLQIYSTRVKPITASPTFNAGTERFIRDWTSTHVSVVVRDSRMRENDPILGIIFLKASASPFFYVQFVKYPAAVI